MTNSHSKPIDPDWETLRASTIDALNALLVEYPEMDREIGYLVEFFTNLPDDFGKSWRVVLPAVYVCLMRCPVPVGRGGADASCGGCCKDNDVENFRTCATVESLTEVAGALLRGDGSVKFGDLLDLSMFIFNAPGRKTCKVPTPEAGKPYQSCPSHTKRECIMLAKLLNVVARPFLALGIPLLIFGMAGTSCELEERMVPLLDEAVRACVGPMCTHAANLVAHRLTWKKPEQVGVMTTNMRELSEYVDEFHDDNELFPQSGGQVIDALVANQRLRFVVQDVDSVNVKALSMSEYWRTKGTEVGRLMSEEWDGSSEQFLRERVLSQLRVSSAGTKMGPTRQRARLTEWREAGMISAVQWETLVSMAVPAAPSAAGRESRLVREVRQLLAEEQDGSSEQFLREHVLSKLQFTSTGSKLLPHDQHTRLGRCFDDGAVSAVQYDLLKPMLDPPAGATEAEIRRLLADEWDGSSEQFLRDHVLSKLQFWNTGSKLQPKEQHARLDNMLAARVFSIEVHDILKPMLDPLGPAWYTNDPFIGAELSNAVHYHAAYPKLNALRSTVEDLVLKRPGGRRPADQSNRLVDRLVAEGYIDEHEAGMIRSCIPQSRAMRREAKAKRNVAKRKQDGPASII